MKFETFHWKKGQLLAEDYIHSFDRVKTLYEYDPQSADSWAARAQWLDRPGRPAADRQGLVRALAEFNRNIGNSEEAQEAIRKLEDPQTLVVAGGQQAGLFGGPLLVVYKAVTLLQAARHAERQLGRKVVPVFWIAGEDHDFDEVNHTYALTPQLGIEKIRLERPAGPRTSITRLAIPSWEEALAELDAALLPTEFKPDLMERLKRFSDESQTLVDFFARMMAWLFGRYGLILVDSDNAAIRKLEGEMFRKLLLERESLNDALLGGKIAVEALGYRPQAEVAVDSVNLFVFDDHQERVLLYRDGESFSDRKGERRFTLDQLLEWTEKEPQRFSNNVMTRPLMQDYLFPVLAAVLGPGEIAYWGLTRREFEAAGMQMPILVPRAEFTLIEGTIAKNMGKFDLSFEDVVSRFEERKEAWLRASDELQLEEQFSRAKIRFQELYEPLVRLIAGINPGMEKLGNTNMQKIIEQIDFLQTRSVEANKQQFDGAIRQWDRIRLTVVPQGRPQERVYNAAPYLTKYGQGWISELIEAPAVLDGSHRVVYL